MGTIRRENQISHPDFQGPEEAHRTSQNRDALREQHPYLRAKRFHGLRP